MPWCQCGCTLWQVLADVLAEVGELTHYAAADSCVFGLADEQDGLYACKHAIDIGNVALIFEVYGVAYAANDELCSYRLGKICCQPFVAHYVDAWLCLVKCSDALCALFWGKHGVFPSVDADSDVELIYEAQGAAY